MARTDNASPEARRIVDEVIGATENFFGAESQKREGHIHIYAKQIDALRAAAMEDLTRKAREMRAAIDMIESALMGFGDLVDLPDRWGEPRMGNHVRPLIDVRASDVYRVCDALKECTRIINSDEYIIATPSVSSDKLGGKE